ncbi:unnamed protein product [Owenia fusiformis]|uniref:BTB domain-containing protein n=1 Tax=Owenia fusiformis TaxID=6347 RepID=A0A8S4PJ51_OWEFU|nr:unnamed protein product [Owenia fusiformis]
MNICSTQNKTFSFHSTLQFRCVGGKVSTIKMSKVKKHPIADPKNPRVLLRPVRKPFKVNTTPPIASQFNNPESSDIVLKVGNDLYYSHRIVLCAASEVFSSMLGPDWIESKKSELVLREDSCCVKVFRNFLQYLYSGSLCIKNDHVFSVFLLADKYNVKNLYDECVKQIVDSLSVRVELIPTTFISKSVSASSLSFLSSDTSSSDSESSDSYVNVIDPSPHDSPMKRLCKKQKRKEILVPEEGFSMDLVIKMANYFANKAISEAALYNLESRLVNSFRQNNYSVWNSLDESLVTKMLSDTNFYVGESILFSATKKWLNFHPDRQKKDVIKRVISQIRFPVLSIEELYDVEQDEIIRGCDEAKELVTDAIRFNLFKGCKKATSNENWNAPRYQRRCKKEKGFEYLGMPAMFEMLKPSGSSSKKKKLS